MKAISVLVFTLIFSAGAHAEKSDDGYTNVHYDQKSGFFDKGVKCIQSKYLEEIETKFTIVDAKMNANGNLEVSAIETYGGKKASYTFELQASFGCILKRWVNPFRF